MIRNSLAALSLPNRFLSSLCRQPFTIVLVAGVIVANLASGQAVDPRKLDRRAEDAKMTFLKELDTLAKDYEEAGLLDRAKETLRKRQGVERSDAIKAKLDELDELDFELNKKELKITPDRGWTDSGLDVTEGESVRIEADGQIRLILNLEVGPDGLALADDLKDVPAGSLIAVVFPPREGRKKPEPTEPVVVGARSQFEPKKSGRLFLRVVTPEAAKSLGSYDVVISGKFRPAGGRTPSRR